MLFSLRTPTSASQSSMSRPPVRHEGIRCADMLSLVGFNDNANVLSPFVSAFDANFVKAVMGLPAAVSGCSTNITAGLRLANDLIGRMPRGLRRRIWLLTDGGANAEIDGIWRQVERARQQYTNINTIGFGDAGQFDKDLLTRVADATHNGKYFEATTINALGATFQHAAGHRPRTNHRGEATAFVIDCSGSMVIFSMGGRKRIEVVRDAMTDLLRYKQAVWS
jgi:Mg-chelatase subunit ChlD